LPLDKGVAPLIVPIDVEEERFMRYEVATTLIICGTLLALAPPVSDYISDQQIAQILVARKDFTSFSMGIPPMSTEYRLGCWALGAVMIGIGVVGSWCGRACSASIDASADPPNR
jgi:hypothetical protein